MAATSAPACGLATVADDVDAPSATDARPHAGADVAATEPINSSLAVAHARAANDGVDVAPTIVAASRLSPPQPSAPSPNAKYAPAPATTAPSYPRVAIAQSSSWYVPYASAYRSASND